LSKILTPLNSPLTFCSPPFTFIASLLQKWGAIYYPKSLWDLKTEIISLFYSFHHDESYFTIISLCRHHVSSLVNIIHYYNLLW
jgi:hypothetical protein